MVLGIAIGYASADFHRREGLVVQTVIREWMRNDAKLTFLLIEVVCVAALAAYLIEHMFGVDLGVRSEEHTSELQSLMRISYAVFCLKKKKEQKLMISKYH